MNLLKSFSFYTIAGFFIKGISFLLLPFFTHYLTQADYGLITIFSNSVYFITPLMSLGIGETLTVEYNTLTKKDLASFISTSIIFPIFISIITVLITLFIAKRIENIIGLKSIHLYLLCLLCWFNFFIDYFFTIIRNQNKPILYTGVGMLKTVLELLLAILFIKVFSQGAMGRVNSIVISAAICFLFVLIYFIKNKLINFTYQKKWLSIILKRGLPSIPFFLMLFILNNADKYFINYYHGSGATGVYGLAGQIAMIINLIAAAFVTPFYPFFYENLRLNQFSKILKVVFIYLALLFCATIVLGFCSPFLFNGFISKNFTPSIKFIFLLSLSQFCWGVFILFLGYLYYKKENYKLYYISITTILFTVIINYLVIKQCTTINWAVASLASYLFCLLTISIIYYKNIYRLCQHLKLLFFKKLLIINKQ